MTNRAKFSLGIDGGASSAKWCLVDQELNIVKQGVLPPIDGHLYRTDSLARFRNFLSSVGSEVEAFAIDAVVIGVTGFGAPEQISLAISEVFPSAQIRMSSDVALAYRSEFSPGEGIYLYAGTGSVAIHLSADNREISVGGWGYLLGDEGAGFWIGREAVRHLLFQIESNENLDLLSTKIAQHLGGANWSSIRSFVYGQDRSATAALSTIVANCASEGDSAALAIFENAAVQLADLVMRLEKLLDDHQLPVIFGGGISETLMSELLKKKLGIPLKNSHANHSFTAAKLGMGLC